MILVQDVLKSVEFPRLTGNLRKFRALVHLANIFQLQTFFDTPCSVNSVKILEEFSTVSR